MQDVDGKPPAAPRMRFMWIFSMALFPLGLGGLILGTGDLAMGIRSRHWNPVPGVVLSAEAIPGVLGPAQPSVRYSYRVGDVPFTGMAIWPGRIFQALPVVAPGVAYGVLRRFPPGEPITVYVDPDNPTRSALILGPTRAIHWTATFAILFLIGVWAPLTSGVLRR